MPTGRSGKLLVVVNDRAGDGKPLGLLGGLRDLDPALACDVLRTRDARDLDAALGAAAPDEYAGVVVVGGDGTLHHCLPALAASGLPVLVFPGGTVNDLAHALGIAPSWDAARALVDGPRARPMRLLAVNGRPFAVYGAIGLGAHTSRWLRERRERLRALRRAAPLLLTPAATARTILFERAHVRDVRLTVDGVARELRTPGIYVANQPRLNKRIDLGWAGSGDAGRFLLVVLRDATRRSLLRTVWRLNAAGSLAAVAADLETHEASHAVVESLDGAPVAFVGDGEPAAEAARLELTVAPRPLVVWRGAAA